MKSIFSSMVISHLFVLFGMGIFCYFLYYGIAEPPPLGDSHDYHIPIARSFLDWSFLNLPYGLNPSIYYPGSSNAILAIFLLFQIPVNYFGLLGWVLLLFLCKRLGEHYGLSKELATIFSLSTCTSVSFIRQIHTQSIDMWIAVFFVWSLLLVENPKETVRYFILLGFSLGMMIGSKASGPLYAGVLFLMYVKDIILLVSVRKFIIFFVMILVFGLFWYIRNYLFYGNPLYPADFGFMKGYPGFPLQDMLFWKTPFSENGIREIINASVSEYLIWGFSPLFVVCYFLWNIGKGRIRKNNTSKIAFLSLLILFVSFLLPIPTLNITSNMRYLFPLLIPSILFLFLLAKEKGHEEIISFLAFFHALYLLPQLDYYPKLYILIIVLLSFVCFKTRVIRRIIAL